MNYIILQKAKPYTRVKRGRLERVRGYSGKIAEGRVPFSYEARLEELRGNFRDILRTVLNAQRDKAIKPEMLEHYKIVGRDIAETYIQTAEKIGLNQNEARDELNIIAIEVSKEGAKEESKEYKPEPRMLREKPKSWAEMGITYISTPVRGVLRREGWKSSKDVKKEAEANAFMMMSEMATLHNINLPTRIGRPLQVRGGRSGRHHCGAVYYEGRCLIEFKEFSYDALPHEFGHFLFDQILPNEKVLGFVNEVRKTPEHMELLEYVKKRFRLTGRKSKYGRRYWDAPTEIFARAYEQWVYDKLPEESPLKKALNKHREGREYINFKESLPKVVALIDRLVTENIDAIRKALGGLMKYVILEKAQVQPYIRYKKGKLEHVKGYQFTGKKWIDEAPNYDHLPLSFKGLRKWMNNLVVMRPELRTELENTYKFYVQKPIVSGHEYSEEYALKRAVHRVKRTLDDAGYFADAKGDIPEFTIEDIVVGRKVHEFPSEGNEWHDQGINEIASEIEEHYFHYDKKKSQQLNDWMMKYWEKHEARDMGDVSNFSDAVETKVREMLNRPKIKEEE